VDGDLDLSAIDALFLLACRRSECYVMRIQRHDWARLPRSLEFGFANGGIRNCDQLRESAKEFFSTAIRELLQANGNGNGGTHLEILRAMQLRIDGIPAQQLAEHLDDDPVRQRDPRTYRNWIKAYGYPQVREWACASPPTASSPTGGSLRAESGLSHEPEIAEDIARSPHPRWRPRSALIALALMTTLVAWLVHDRFIPRPIEATSDPGQESTAHSMIEIPVEHIGLHVEMGDGNYYHPILSEVISKDVLPNLQSPLSSLTVVARNDIRRSRYSTVPIDSVKIVLGTAKGGLSPGTVALWDPKEDVILWRYRFEPRPGEAEMSPDLPRDVGSEPYRVRWLAHSSPYGSLGTDSVVAIFQQRWSPHFAVFLDLRTGKELARYSAYGELSRPLVADIDGDGSAEVVLAGCDNICDSAALTVLDPSMTDGASASVGWNTAGEAAKWRVLFPDPRSLLPGGIGDSEFPNWGEPFHPRLHTFEVGVGSWNARAGELTLTVGASTVDRAYYATLVNGRPQPDTATIRLGDAEERLWQAMGLDIESGTIELARRIQVIEHGDNRTCP
jgi:hypothetical protein